MNWQAWGVLATAALGIYNAVRAHLDRQWVRSEPVRAAQREIRAQLRERYEEILADVEAVDSALRMGKDVPDQTPSLDVANDTIRRLAGRLDSERDEAALGGEAAKIMLLHTHINGARINQGLAPHHRRLAEGFSVEERQDGVGADAVRLHTGSERAIAAGHLSIRELIPGVNTVLKERIRVLTDELDRGNQRNL